MFMLWLLSWCSCETPKSASGSCLSLPDLEIRFLLLDGLVQFRYECFHLSSCILLCPAWQASLGDMFVQGEEKEGQ